MFMRTDRLFAPVLVTLVLVTSGSAQAYQTRGTTRTNVNTANVNRNVSASSTNVSSNVNVNTANVNRNVSATTGTANVNKSVTVNEGTANVNKSVTVSEGTVNVNKSVTVSGGCCYNNVGVGGAVAAGVVVGATAAVVGSAIAASALPPACSTVVVNGLAYQNCGGAWYQPQYSGSQVTYIVVNPPK